ncbi:hypothetical protein RQP46_008387 [Phenoliferia psychrophenolica]
MPSPHSLFLAALAAATVSLAHIELIFPPGINSKYDPQTLEANKDYSMTTDFCAQGYGFAYPCKGYNTAALIGALNPVATLEAGTNFQVNMTGSATHGGGSCQFALSYDQGKTFAVIASVIGGCPLAEAYTIPVPKDVPAGTKALFAWTWQNLVGNREEYMNCAVVDVKGTSKSYTGPGLFRANTLGSSECRTVEHQDVVYPNPGPSVQYLDASTSASSPATVLSPCTNNQVTSVTVTSNGGTVAPGTGGSSGSSSSSAPPSPPVVASSSAPIASFSKPIAASSKPIASSSTPVVPSATPPAVSRGPYSSAPAASSLTPLLVASRNSKKVATPTPKPTPARKKPTKSAPAVVAAVSSTPVVAPPAAVAPSAPQSGGAYVTCTSTTTFSLCGGSTCTPMGSVAPGTQCIGGTTIYTTWRLL